MSEVFYVMIGHVGWMCAICVIVGLLDDILQYVDRDSCEYFLVLCVYFVSDLMVCSM